MRVIQAGNGRYCAIYDSQEPIRWQNGATSSCCACANLLEILGKPLQKWSLPIL
jgi:hypothetical protein